MRKATRQTWIPGQSVKVGFLTLTILEKIATPGNHLPDQYALRCERSGRFYKFIPHNGLERCDNLEQACAW